MIDLDQNTFPAIAVECIYDRLTLLDDTDPQTVSFHMRVLNARDDNIAVGVFATNWTAREESREIMGPPGTSTPTINRYEIAVQSMVKDGDQPRGLRRHSVLAKLVRSALDRDAAFQLAFQQLQSSVGGSRETMGRFGISAQRFRSADIRGSFIHLSTLDFWFETQTN